MYENRGFGSIIVLIMLVSGSFLFFGAGSDTVSGNDDLDQHPMNMDKNGNWTVDGIETYNSTIIDLSGNLTISGTLILDSVDLVLNGTMEYPSTIEVQDGGILIIQNGSTISSSNDIGYAFMSNGTSKVEINRSTVRDCGLLGQDLKTSGIYTESTNFRVLDSIIENGTTGIIGISSNIAIIRSSIRNMDYFGLQMDNGCTLQVIGLNISQCGEIGIWSDRSQGIMNYVDFYNLERPIELIRSVFDLTNIFIDSFSPMFGSITSSNVTITDSIGSSRSGSILQVLSGLFYTSDVHLVNTTNMDVIVMDPNAWVRSSIRYDIKVVSNYRPPASDAMVVVRNSTDDVVFEGSTQQNGKITDILLVSRIFNMTGSHRTSIYNATVDYQDAFRYQVFDVFIGHEVKIDVIINDPVVKITYPLNDTWIAEGEFLLRGEIEDEREITGLWISINENPDLSIDPANEFSIPMNLPDGEHDIRIMALNDDGRLGSQISFFGVDTQIPDLAITSPEDGFYTNSSNVLIEGTCSLDAHIYLGQDMVANVDGKFKASYLLNDGGNDIRIRAVDLAGNTAMKTITVYRDADPPNLMILAPINGTITNEDEIVVLGSVDADARIVSVNGVDVEIVDGKFEYAVSLDMEGMNRIQIIAEDRTGTRTVRVLTIIKDTTPPFLSLVSIPHITSEETITIRGTVDPGSTVLVNNRMIAVEGGTFSEMISLFEGENSIMVVAVDDLGNEEIKEVKVILDTTMPVMDSIIPASGTMVSNPILQISALVFDEIGISVSRGKLNNGPFQLISNEDNWTWVVTLVDGENIIDIEVEDEAGNVLFKQLSYTLSPSSAGDVEPPLVVISIPSSNESIEAGRITIEGWALDDQGLSIVELRVDDGEWMEVEGLQTWSIEVDLVKGIYILEARATDTSGNVATDSIWISIYIPDDDTQDDKGSSDWPIYIGLGAFLLVISGLTLYMLVVRIGYQRELRDRSDSEENEKAPRRRGYQRRGSDDIDEKPRRSVRDRKHRPR